MLQGFASFSEAEAAELKKTRAGVLSAPVVSALSACGSGSPNAERLAVLRRMMAEKFPFLEAKAGGVFPTGLPGVDAAEGSLRRAAMTELTTSTGAGSFFILRRRALWGRRR